VSDVFRGVRGGKSEDHAGVWASFSPGVYFVVARVLGGDFARARVSGVRRAD
jgi:hypothetical protein